jgi:hypothetical protein
VRRWRGRNREWKGGEKRGKRLGKRNEIRDLLPSFDWKFLHHPPYCLGTLIILVLSLISRSRPRNLMAQASSFHITQVFLFLYEMCFVRLQQKMKNVSTKHQSSDLTPTFCSTITFVCAFPSSYNKK